MENVFAAVVLIFLFLFGGFTFTNAFFTAQGIVQAAKEKLDSRTYEIENTVISPVDLDILNAGSQIKVTLRNAGTVRLADFDHWDVFTEYYDTNETPTYHIARLGYGTTEAPSNNWTVEGIYFAGEDTERYEAGILNSGEDLVLLLNVSPPVGVEQSAQVTVVTDNGSRASIVGMRNAPPVLEEVQELRVAAGGRALLTLHSEDTDNTPDELEYTITTPPAQGTLTPETSFTQALLDSGDVFYSHTGTEADSFEFTVSDGIDIIGPFPISIVINAPPVLETNAGLTLPAGESAVITNALLQVMDDDDEPEDLIYTIVQFPSNGTLGLGSTFSQADIDNNRLTYTHTGADADLFKFVVSDGYDVIGTNTFIVLPVGQPEGT